MHLPMGKKYVFISLQEHKLSFRYIICQSEIMSPTCEKNWRYMYYSKIMFRDITTTISERFVLLPLGMVYFTIPQLLGLYYSSLILSSYLQL